MTATQIDLNGNDEPEKVCACGCKRSLEGMRKDAHWYSRACAVRWGRENPGKKLSDAYSPNKGRTRTRHKPSGLQVSYRKAVNVLTDLLTAEGIGFTGTCWTGARPEAERVLAKALSPRQRERLEQLRERSA